MATLLTSVVALIEYSLVPCKDIANPRVGLFPLLPCIFMFTFTSAAVFLGLFWCVADDSGSNVAVREHLGYATTLWWAAFTGNAEFVQDMLSSLSESDKFAAVAWRHPHTRETPLDVARRVGAGEGVIYALSAFAAPVPVVVQANANANANIPVATVVVPGVVVGSSAAQAAALV